MAMNVVRFTSWADFISYSAKGLQEVLVFGPDFRAIF